ncbi:MAG TPA: hypothetical protein VF474_08725 [Phenylobacterium sp.]
MLAVIGLTSQNDQLVRAAYVANGFTANLVIVPMMAAALLTGLVSALGTRWGLFRYYWVLVKLLITALAALVLLMQLRGIDYVANVAAARTLESDFRGLRASFVVHSAGGLLVLLLPLLLSIYKPPGMTRHGWRKQQHRPAWSARPSTCRSLLPTAARRGGIQNRRTMRGRRRAVRMLQRDRHLREDQ